MHEDAILGRWLVPDLLPVAPWLLHAHGLLGRAAVRSAACTGTLLRHGLQTVFLQNSDPAKYLGSARYSLQNLGFWFIVDVLHLPGTYGAEVPYQR